MCHLSSMLAQSKTLLLIMLHNCSHVIQCKCTQAISSKNVCSPIQNHQIASADLPSLRHDAKGKTWFVTMNPAVLVYVDQSWSGSRSTVCVDCARCVLGEVLAQVCSAATSRISSFVTSSFGSSGGGGGYGIRDKAST